MLFDSSTALTAGDEDDDTNGNNDEEEPIIEAGDYNLGDDLTRAGDGHDPDAEPV